MKYDDARAEWQQASMFVHKEHADSLRYCLYFGFDKYEGLVNLKPCLSETPLIDPFQQQQKLRTHDNQMNNVRDLNDAEKATGITISGAELIQKCC